MVPPTSNRCVPLWGRFEGVFTSTVKYDNESQGVFLQVNFEAPSGAEITVDGFWDGDNTWRVRLCPCEEGEWRYTTACSDRGNDGLHAQTGTFVCTPPRRDTPFARHGPIRVSDNCRYLVHADGTPFFWLADTAWSGPLLSTDEEWDFYLKERLRQRFTAVQWIATQYRAVPHGDRDGRLAYTGRERIAVNPAFFQRLDNKLDAINRAGLLAAPVLLWANPGRNYPDTNPGHALPDDQAILLARYMVARWQANAVVWILNGDGDYEGEKAERWGRIGRGVFGDRPHAPVALHPRSKVFLAKEFENEDWLDIVGYQSGHHDDNDGRRWIVSGPISQEWSNPPPRIIINLEPCYENHVAYQTGQPFTPLAVRRACYWSLMNAPTAGVTYGGHGVWGWDDGSGPPCDHPNTGTPFPWQEALLMPGAEQMAHLADTMTSLHWWKLRPAPELVAMQPGEADTRRFISACRSPDGDLAIIYVPEDRSVELCLDGLPRTLQATWVNPRTGERTPVGPITGIRVQRLQTPDEGDWMFLLES